MVSSRRFDTGRTYKLLRVIVLTIALPALLVGIYGLKTQPEYSLSQLDMYSDCIEISSDDFANCDHIIKEVSRAENLWQRNLTIGILLPLIFFGGSALYNYLFPKKV